MTANLRFSLRELLMLVVIACFAAATLQSLWAEDKPVYLHVFGTHVSQTHDSERPKSAPPSSQCPPWTRVATISVYDRQAFGVFTPNDRSPEIGIDGRLQRTTSGNYQGTVHFRLDDSNLTYDFREKVDLPLEKLAYIDDYYYCYLISASKDPYTTLKKAMQPVAK